jgi:hypothetical protein
MTDKANPAETLTETPAAAPSENGAATLELMSKDDILGIEDRRYKIVHVRAWNNRPVRIQSLTSREREEYENSITVQGESGTKTNIITARAKLCVRIMVDKDGRRIMDDSYIGALANKSADAIGQIFEEGSKFSAITKKDVEELAGNSGGGNIE